MTIYGIWDKKHSTWWRVSDLYKVLDVHSPDRIDAINWAFAMYPNTKDAENVLSIISSEFANDLEVKDIEL